ncbi:MAG TPA: ABC transporter permease [Solirubrobacterales bacterium]|nr:ABC transporter permease [Solirubrobacterales bacterium]
MDWSEVIGPGALVVLISSGVAFAMPMALAAVGETVAERSGVLNLGLEGMLLSGAFVAFVVAYYVGSVALGTAAGIAIGVVLGALMAFLSVTLKTEQIINGIAIVLLATGLTAFLFEKIFGGEQRPTITGLSDVEIPLLASIPGIGEILFDQNVLFYVSFALAIGVAILLARTRFGLAVRAVGESPAAADAMAVSVGRIRWMALLICGGMAGLGGAVLVLGQLNLFETNVSGGRGWIAIALVIFGRWNPLLVLGGAFLFGFTNALQIRVQAVSGGISSSFPYEVFAALPYLVTLAVMVAATVLARRDAMPAALGVPFRKEAGA